MKKLLLTLVIALMLSGGQMILAQDKGAGKSTGKTISGGIINGKAISLPAPKYPEEARKNNFRGAVTVQVIIDETGSVQAAKATSGHPDLREASTAAALKSKFKPTLLEDKPVKVRGVIIYNFGNRRVRKLKTTTLYADRDVLNSRALKLPAPAYSAEAVKECLLGSVEVDVTLDAKGNVTAAKAVKGHPLLRGISEKAAMKSRFQTDKTSGKIIYNFDYTEECKN